jgi:hypothetical protein
MNNPRKIAGSISPTSQALNWIVVSSSLVTIFFWTNANDPFNAPKSWILGISGFWLLGWVISQLESQLKDPTSKRATFLALAFFGALCFAFLFTDNKYIAFFGDYQRRTGFLTYLNLIIFFIAASYLFRFDRIARLEIAVVFTATIVGAYGAIQHFGKDFVHWNNPYNSVLSTLGNPDFASAVMAIFVVICFGVASQSKFSLWLRMVAVHF